MPEWEEECAAAAAAETKMLLSFAHLVWLSLCLCLCSVLLFYFGGFRLPHLFIYLLLACLLSQCSIVIVWSSSHNSFYAIFVAYICYIFFSLTLYLSFPFHLHVWQQQLSSFVVGAFWWLTFCLFTLSYFSSYCFLSAALYVANSRIFMFVVCLLPSSVSSFALQTLLE